MSEEPTQIPADAPAPVAVDQPEPADSRTPPGATRVEMPAPSPEAADPNPEYMVAGAFAGAFLFAKILRRIGGS